MVKVGPVALLSAPDAPRGAFKFFGAPGDPFHGLAFRCPGCAAVLTIPFASPAAPGFFWDRDPLTPSVKPSIVHSRAEDSDEPGSGCGWHGMLVDGVWHDIAGSSYPVKG